MCTKPTKHTKPTKRAKHTKHYKHYKITSNARYEKCSKYNINLINELFAPIRDTYITHHEYIYTTVFDSTRNKIGISIPYYGL